jgi:hypothetical protein
MPIVMENDNDFWGRLYLALHSYKKCLRGSNIKVFQYPLETSYSGFRLQFMFTREIILLSWTGVAVLVFSDPFYYDQAEIGIEFYLSQQSPFAHWVLNNNNAVRCHYFNLYIFFQKCPPLVSFIYFIDILFLLVDAASKHYSYPPVYIGIITFVFFKMALCNRVQGRRHRQQAYTDLIYIYW